MQLAEIVGIDGEPIGLPPPKAGGPAGHEELDPEIIEKLAIEASGPETLDHPRLGVGTEYP
jgi:hypothetical protein